MLNFFPSKGNTEKQQMIDTGNYLTGDQTREMTRLSMWGLSHKNLDNSFKTHKEMVGNIEVI